MQLNPIVNADQEENVDLVRLILVRVILDMDFLHELQELHGEVVEDQTVGEASVVVLQTIHNFLLRDVHGVVVYLMVRVAEQSEQLPDLLYLALFYVENRQFQIVLLPGKRLKNQRKKKHTVEAQHEPAYWILVRKKDVLHFLISKVQIAFIGVRQHKFEEFYWNKTVFRERLR